MNTSPESEPPIDAHFFEQILETDLANIVKKASNGSPLSKREREMIEEERTKLQKKPEPAFKLEGEGPVSRLAGMTQRELAEEWGYSERSIKGWLADGRSKNDPCPLTRPAEMPEWFSRVHAPRQCPDKLRNAADRICAGETARAQSAPAGDNLPPAERIEVAEEEKGLLAMLNRYRNAEATLHQKYMAAIDSGNEQRAGFLMREWSEMGEKLRALEKVAPKALEELGIYVRKDEVLRELEPLHRAIIKAIRQALRMSRPRLKAAASAEEWNRITDQVVDETAQMLVDSDFAEPLELEAA